MFLPSDEPFEFITQRHYENLGVAVLAYIQHRMVADLGMHKVVLPLSTPESTPHSCMYVSPDLETNTDKLIVLVQGSGAVRPGQWARALCINESLDHGSMLPTIKAYRDDGYAVAVLNPNEHFWVDGDERVPIPGNRTSTKHFLLAYDQVISNSPAKHMVILCHSAGGFSTCGLVRFRRKKVLPRLRAVAMTDAVHNVSVPHPAVPICRARSRRPLLPVRVCVCV